MIKKLRLSSWIYYISLVFFVLCILGIISELLKYTYPILLYIVYIGAYFSPIALVLLLIDIIFNKECKKRYCILAIIMNLIFIGFTIYFSMNYMLQIG